MASRTCNMVLLFYLVHITGENNVSLTPSPEILVKEGETIDLQCDYTGLHYPNYVNWYLNNDTFGLVIDTTNCAAQAEPEVYRTYNLSSSCNITSFNLSIANISKTKDDGDIWKCDITIIGMQPPSKALTTIKVIETVEIDTDRVASSESLIVVVIIVIVFPGLLITVAAIFVCLKHRKREMDETNDQRNGEDTMRALNRTPDSEEQENELS